MYGTSDTPLSIRLSRTLYDQVPTAVTASLSPLYFWYQSRRADRRHDPPTIAHRRVADAPDHVLLVVIDALRPDFVPDLPLDFRHAIAPSTWTFPSVTSLHTGQYPHEHGAVAHTRIDDDEYAMPRQLDDGPTLPAELEAAGYDTYCGSAFVVPFIAVRGWYGKHRLYADESAETLIPDYLSWRSGRDRTFGYLHLGDLHDPIDVPEAYLEGVDGDAPLDADPDPCVEFDGCDACVTQRERHMTEYRAALAYVEDNLRRLIDVVGDDTLVVVTADHGEGQGEHYERAARITDSRPNGGGGRRGNVGHGGTPFDVVARVPVGINRPGGASIQPTGGWASLCDLPATILEDTVADPRIDGQRWQTPIPDTRAVLCEGVRFGVERKAVYRDGAKVIRSRADDETFTARVERSEPGERFEDLSAHEREELLALLPDHWEDFDARTDVGPVVEEQLEALGYG